MQNALYFSVRCVRVFMHRIFGTLPPAVHHVRHAPRAAAAAACCSATGGAAACSATGGAAVGAVVGRADAVGGQRARLAVLGDAEALREQLEHPHKVGGVHRRELRPCQRAHTRREPTPTHTAR